MIVAVFKTVGIVTGFKDVAMMGKYDQVKR